VGGEVPLRVEADIEQRHPGADRLATECVINLLRSAALVATDLGRRLAPHHLTAPSLNVLMTLQRAGGSLTPRELAERLIVTPGTVTGLLDTLERQHLLRRVRHPVDGRRLVVELTEAAGPLLDEVCSQHYPAQAELLGDLSERDKQTLIRLLGKVQQAVLAVPR
jgi:DNA-binding MarR family transcriptional regulator